jgi:hypothetical protein
VQARAPGATWLAFHDLVDEVPEDDSHGRVRKSPPRLADEERRAVDPRQDAITCADVCLEGLDRRRVQRDQARLVELRLADREHASGQVGVLAPQV